MNPTEIEFAVRALVAEPYNPAIFPFDLVAIYNAPKVTVSKLKSGQTNAAIVPGDVLWKKHIFFRSVAFTDDVAAMADILVSDPLTVKHKPRFIFVTNGNLVHVRDLGRDETCDTEFARLDESAEFLLPLAGFERPVAVTEHPADVKAAKRLKKLYEALLAANPSWSGGNFTHELNLFMTRILFCFYAEDTGIFDTPQLFTKTVAQFTKEDGSDVAPLLDRLFRVMNLKREDRPSTLSAVDERFPYVNGSLFETTLPIPALNRTARRLFLECGDLYWKDINPDIFGSMIQTITEPGMRGDLGMHYTSVPNIMRVIQPLFLDDLDDAYERAKDSVPRLDALLTRLASIRVFDPACGCGNFLIIAYKELRKAEMRILSRISELAPNNPLRFSGISLHNFYGVDIVDFACETAKLSLWIAEHQVNATFKELFGTTRPPLPLGKISTIRNGNALRLDWGEVCPHDASTETYICGNPPYQGGKKQDVEEKMDVTRLFRDIAPSYKNIDYVACWFVKAADYIVSPREKAALVATSSLCQGENVPILWPALYSAGVEISFAHTSFRWTNNAAHNAAVACIVVGLALADARVLKRLYTDGHVAQVKNINPYLVPGPTIIVDKESHPIQGLPEITYGSKPLDWGHLTLSAAQHEQILNDYPEAKPLMRRYYGSDEFIDGVERWCLWIPDDKLYIAKAIKPISQRLIACRDARMKGGISARDNASTPHRFMVNTHRDTDGMLIPMVSSERRHFLQIGIMPGTTIINSNAFALYSPPAYLLAILSSRLHYIWAATVGGKLENRLRYSNTLIYNTFPIPALSAAQQRILGEHSRAILKARAKHPGKTIAWLYNPETMPVNLLEAHKENDAYLEEYVYGRTFRDDTHRLEHLFAMYSSMKARKHTPLLAANPTRSKKVPK